MPAFQFEHNLTRPYPFRWYTPAVVVGFLFATILFSLLNYASSGYTLQAEYLTDPHPESWPGMDSWYKRWPSGLVGGNKPSCQPASIPLGTTLYTNNTALPWTVDDVGRLSNDTIESLPSLVYQGEQLTDCELIMITVKVQLALETKSHGPPSSPWSTELEGKVYCRIHTATSGSIETNLTTKWSLEYNIDHGRLLVATRPFLGGNESYSSLHWAFISLREWNGILSVSLQDPRSDQLNYTGLWTMFSRDSENAIDEIKSRRFFNVSYEYIENSHNDDVRVWTSRANAMDPSIQDTTIQYLLDSGSIINPDLWTQADDLSKILLSAMWTDLGQASKIPNIFSDPALLRYYTQDEVRSQDYRPHLPYEESPAANARLGIRPSVLATNYLCQVPRRKPLGSLIIAVLVADLVFLRTLWAVVTMVSTYFAKQQDPLANTCETCARSLRQVAESNHEESPAASSSNLGLRELNTRSSSRGQSQSPVIGVSDLELRDLNDRVGRRSTFYNRRWATSFRESSKYIGNSVLLESISLTRTGGRMLQAGWLDGLVPVPDFNPMVQMESGVHFSLFHSKVLGTPGFPISGYPLQEIVHKIERGEFDARPVQVFDYSDIVNAHAMLDSHNAGGKIVVKH